ncbi:MAG: YceD family protein [Gallionella sp.]|nr:YceD family protein [Gallionella sp.]MDD4946125.1 YceD family protein [Gallionella sp.]MDD5612661.1 YceD family protein [Gallionella sp.]
MYARPFIDSLDFARNGMQMDAEVPFAELSRLRDVLEDTQGVLRYSLKGAMDVQGSPVLDVSMSGLCHLRCQRCLQGMDYAIQYETRLILRNEAELDELQDDDEEFDSILADPNLDVLELLEEEILLSLPIAPRHELGACQAAASESVRQEEKHPFAVLEKLKQN